MNEQRQGRTHRPVNRRLQIENKWAVTILQADSIHDCFSHWWNVPTDHQNAVARREPWENYHSMRSWESRVRKRSMWSVIEVRRLNKSDKRTVMLLIIRLESMTTPSKAHTIHQILPSQHGVGGIGFKELRCHGHIGEQHEFLDETMRVVVLVNAVTNWHPRLRMERKR